MNTRAWLLLITMAAIQFAHIVDFMIMMPLGPQLMRKLNIGPDQFSQAVSVYSLAAGIMGFLSLYWTDRFDRKKIQLFVFALFAIGTLFCGLSTDYNSLFFSRAFTGAFGGLLTAVNLAIVADLFPIEKRARAMSIVMAGFSVASILGVPIGLKLAQSQWNLPFLILALICVFIWILIYFTLPPVNKHIVSQHIPPFEKIKEVFLNPNQRTALALMFLLVFGQFSIIPFLSPYLVANVGFLEDELFYVYLIGGLVTIFTSPFVGWLADKYGKAKILIFTALYSIVPFFLVTNLTSNGLGFSLLVTSLFMIGIGSRMTPAVALVSSTTHPSKRGSFMCMTSACQQLAAGSASALAGQMVSKNTTGQLLHFSATGYIAVATTIIALLLVRKIKAIA